MRADELVREARHNLEQGDTKAARQNLKLALTFFPKHVDALALLNRLPKRRARSSSRARMPSSPRSKPLARAQSTAEATAIELYERANKEAAVGNLEEATQTLRRAITKCENAGFYNRLAILLGKQREFEQALHAIENALRLAPENDTYSANREKLLVAAASNGAKKKAPEKRSGSFIGSLFRRD